MPKQVGVAMQRGSADTRTREIMNSGNRMLGSTNIHSLRYTYIPDSGKTWEPDTAISCVSMCYIYVHNRILPINKCSDRFLIFVVTTICYKYCFIDALLTQGNAGKNLIGNTSLHTVHSCHRKQRQYLRCGFVVWVIDDNYARSISRLWMADVGFLQTSFNLLAYKLVYALHMQYGSMRLGF